MRTYPQYILTCASVLLKPRLVPIPGPSCTLPGIMGGSQRDGVTQKQYLHVLKAMWCIVDKYFQPEKVLTPLGHALCQTYAIKAAHPEMPYALHFLSMMCALCNGAKTELFAHSDSPLFHLFFNINYTQTRKSSLTGNGDAFGDALDKEVADKVLNKHRDVQAKLRDRLGEEALPPSGKPKVTSSVLHSATPTEFFHRLSGDFDQVENLEKLGCDELRGRHWFGALLNFDEAYDFLTAFGLLSEETAAKGKGGRQGVNPHQSALNKLLQYGQAARATKSCGSFGAAGSPTVSAGVTSNLHPSQYVPMERCEIGSHHAATKERSTIATGRPVQPHAPLPADYELPAGHARSKWVPLVPDVADVLGLAEGAVSPDVAKTLWARVKPNTLENGEMLDGITYFPDAEGFKVTLPDGVCSQVRFKLAPDGQQVSGFEAEWQISNRDFPTPPQHDLKTCCNRLFTYFAKPHMKLSLAADAKALFQSFMGSYNVKGHLLREKGDIHGGARLGAAPWQLGELSSMLMIFDIFCGRYDGTSDFDNKSLKIQKEHVSRAASLLNVIHRLKEAAVNTEADENEDGPVEDELNRQNKIREETMQFLSSSGDMFDGLFSQSAFQGYAEPDLAPTMPDDADLQLPETRPEVEEEEPAEAPAEVPAEAAESAEAEAEAVEAPAAPTVPVQPQDGSLLTLADVKATSYGYGEGGASVQDKFHRADLTDRVVMQKTLLCGKPVIPCKQAVETLQSSARDGRKAMPRGVWATVMQKGLEGCAVARYENNNVYLKEIPVEASARISYHNELMKLCGVSLQDLVGAMKKAKVKQDQKMEKRKAKSSAASANSTAAAQEELDDAATRGRSRSRSRRASTAA